MEGLNKKTKTIDLVRIITCQFKFKLKWNHLRSESASRKRRGKIAKYYIIINKLKKINDKHFQSICFRHKILHLSNSNFLVLLLKNPSALPFLLPLSLSPSLYIQGFQPLYKGRWGREPSVRRRKSASRRASLLRIRKTSRANRQLRRPTRRNQAAMQRRCRSRSPSRAKKQLERAGGSELSFPSRRTSLRISQRSVIWYVFPVSVYDFELLRVIFSCMSCISCK